MKDVDMQSTDRFVLGLDLGTSSVGWALVRIPEDETQAELVRIGVRKFSDVYTQGDTPSKKNTTSNTDRRNARLMRRQTRRKRNRRQLVLRMLREAGLASSVGEPFPNMPVCRFSPYDIWSRAYDEDLTPFEFGRLLYLFAHRRGFKSNLGAGLGKLKDRPDIVRYLDELERLEREREIAKEQKGKKATSSADDDETKVLVQVGHWHQALGGVPIGKLYMALLAEGDFQQNLGSLLKNSEGVGEFEEHAKRKQVRNKSSLPLWARPDRAAYESDFRAVWARQAPHLGLDDTLQKQLFDALFFQNPLAFPVDNRAYCPFGKITNSETGEILRAHRSPKCNLLFQEYRIRKLLADLKLKDNPEAEYRHLDPIQKQTLFELLIEKNEVSWKDLAKAIHVKGAVFEPAERKQKGSDYSGTGMKGNPIAGWFLAQDDSKPCGQEIRDLWEVPERFLRQDLREEWKGTERGRRDKVRHHLIRIIGDAPFKRADRLGNEVPKASAERVVHLLQLDFDLTDVAAYRLATHAFPDGFGRLSFEAMAALLPHLREGKMEWEAIRDEFGQSADDPSRKPIRFHPSPPSQQDILSPRVRKALNQARHVINELLAEHPEIELDEIRIELARRMQLSNDAYSELLADQKYNQEMNNEAFEFWNKCRPGSKVPNGFTEKYRLWREQDHRCPYTLGDRALISQQDLLDGTRVEVEHIWPRQIGGDSYANKVLVFRTANQNKGGNAPWDLGEEWRTAVSNNIKGWSMFGTKTDDSSTRDAEEYKPRKLPSKAVEKAKSKLRRVQTATKPADREEGFADRQAVETGYIAREAIDYLYPFARKTTAIKSTFSTSLARNWGFYKRLNDLHKDDLDKIPTGKKDRVLLRHHAVDALATALCSPKVIKKVVDLEKHLENTRAIAHELKEMRNGDGPITDPAEAKARWLRHKVAELQPKKIGNGLLGTLANIIVSHEPRRRARGKFFAEQPFGLTAKMVSAGQKKEDGLNRRLTVNSLKAEQVFPELAAKKRKGDDSNEEESASDRGRIRSDLTRQRIANYLRAQGFGPEKGKEAIEEFLKKCSEGIPYRAKNGLRHVRKVLVKTPMDRLENYRIRDEAGGKQLYVKSERFCAVIGQYGNKPFMETVPLVDAALVAKQTGAEFRESILKIAAERGGHRVEDLRDALIIHKGDFVRLKNRKEAAWLPGLYVVEVLEDSGKRLWVREHWSGNKEILKAKAIGHIIASISTYEFHLEDVSPTGVLRE